MSADITVGTSISHETAPLSLPLLQHVNSALNHDFCPSLNRWFYWLKNPIWSLLLASMISLLCGIFLKTEALFITTILLVIVGVGVSLPWLAMRGLDVHLTFDIRRSRVGQPVMIRVRVRNRWPWPVWGLSLVKGFALKETADTDEGVSLAKVRGWATKEYSWPFCPQIRGKYPLAAPELETGFPFGIYRASRKATVDGHVIVWPSTVKLAGLPDTLETRLSEEQLADRRVGDFGDMLGTRLFRQGDSLRRVHWSQTARQQQLIVCERQAPATTIVRVVLDIDRLSHPNSECFDRSSNPTLELAVQVAASVCESLHRQHCQVELVLNDQMLTAGESAVGFFRIMDALAQAAVTDSTSSRKQLRLTSDGFVIAITTPVGLQRHGRHSSGLHVICVSDGSASQRSVPVTGVWIALEGSQDVETRLPRRWKGACNVR